jgi:predicted phosphodiesterase
MSRRGFLKWLLAAIAIVAGAFFSLFQLLTRFGTKPAQPPVADVIVPVPQPEQAPAEEVATVVSTEPLLSFFVLSDLHVSIYDESTPRKLKMALEDITQYESKIDAILLGGDLTDYGMESEYQSLEKILNSYKLPPIYGNMGNHDYYNVWIDSKGGFNREAFPNGKTDAQSRARFQKLMGIDKPYSAVEVNGYSIILLSQEAYIQEMPEVGEGAWYSDEQLNWLKTKLQEAPEGKPIFILIHQPLPPAGQDGGSHRLIRANAFRDILKPYKNVFVISGHTHQDFENGSSHYSKEQFHWFINASVGRTRTRNGQEKAQGLLVQAYEDRVVLRGREFTKKSYIEAADWTVPLERVKV